MCQTPTETGLIVTHKRSVSTKGMAAVVECLLNEACAETYSVREAQVVRAEAIALRDVIGHVAEWAAMMDNLDSRDDEEQANLDANTKMLRNLRSLLAKLPTGAQAQLRARLEGE